MIMCLQRDKKDLFPWCMLFADDILLCVPGGEPVKKKVGKWRRTTEDRRLNISRTKTVPFFFHGDEN